MLKHNNSGFTLIELLVVISIIGMLSSVVLSSVSRARDMAEYQYSVKVWREYTIAIDQYYGDHGFFPHGSLAGGGFEACIGVGSGCVNDSGLDAELKKYLPQLVNINPRPIGGYSGITYLISDAFVDRDADNFIMYFDISGNHPCPSFSIFQSYQGYATGRAYLSASNSTFCTYAVGS